MTTEKNGGNGNGTATTEAAPASNESKETTKGSEQKKDSESKPKATTKKKASKKAKPAKKGAKKAETRKRAKTAAKPTPKAAKAKKDNSNVRTADNSNRDFQRFRFNGEDLPKGRTVLAVVKDFAGRKNMTVAKLQEAFPDDLQKNFGMIKELGAAKKKSGTKKLRYFLREDDVLSLGGRKYVVCNQWSTASFKEFMKVAKGLGYNLTASRK